MRHARLATRSLVLALAALSGCHLYFGDGRGDEPDGGGWLPDAPPDLDAGWPPVDAPTDIDAGMAFPRPTAPMRAHALVNGAWVDQGLADWSCMNTPTSDLPSTGPIQLSGRVTDYPYTMGVAAANIVAYAPSTSAVVGNGVSTSSAGASRGSYTMSLAMLPSTSRRYTFAITAQNYPGTYLLEQYIAPAQTATRDLPVASVATLDALAAYVGLARNPANAMALGTIHDCQGRTVSNAVVIASRSRSTTDLVGGARSFYYSASTPSVPARNDQVPFSNVDGRFMVIDVPPISAGFSVQVLGFRTQAELDANTIRLVSQVWAPAIGGTVSIAPYEPRRSN
ncbi:MAG: hypothetical protein K8M05_41430 [Deltaproteobacteria bacterium]|nr:hypothetical protein [Kofleriaceae bacterium]